MSRCLLTSCSQYSRPRRLYFACGNTDRCIHVGMNFYLCLILCTQSLYQLQKGEKSNSKLFRHQTLHMHVQATRTEGSRIIVAGLRQDPTDTCMIPFPLSFFLFLCISTSDVCLPMANFTDFAVLKIRRLDGLMSSFLTRCIYGTLPAKIGRSARSTPTRSSMSYSVARSHYFEFSFSLGFPYPSPVL